VAVEGDVVTLAQDEIRVNGVVVPNSDTALEDSMGRALQHCAWGEHRIGPGELWLFSPYHRNAYDSRYFGPVHMSQVLSVLLPVLTQQPVGHAHAIPSMP
jgi:type IV secretory pathway protease TraF